MRRILDSCFTLQALKVLFSALVLYSLYFCPRAEGHGFCATLLKQGGDHVDIDWDIDGCCPALDGTVIPEGVFNFRLKTSLGKWGSIAVGFRDRKSDSTSLAGSWIVMGYRNQGGQVGLNEYVVREDGRLQQLPKNDLWHNNIYLHWSEEQFSLEFRRRIEHRYAQDPIQFARNEQPMQFFYVLDFDHQPVNAVDYMWPPKSSRRAHFSIDFFDKDGQHHVGDALEKCRLPVYTNRLSDDVFHGEPRGVLSPAEGDQISPIDPDSSRSDDDDDDDDDDSPPRRSGGGGGGDGDGEQGSNNNDDDDDNDDDGEQKSMAKSTLLSTGGVQSAVTAICIIFLLCIALELV